MLMRNLLPRANMARAAHDKWMQKGPVRKAHNFVVWVHRSDQLTQLLRQLQRDFFSTSIDPEDRNQQPVDVILDNDTRWLSQYYMIKRMLRVQPYYEEFIVRGLTYSTHQARGGCV